MWSGLIDGLTWSFITGAWVGLHLSIPIVAYHSQVWLRRSLRNFEVYHRINWIMLLSLGIGCYMRKFILCRLISEYDLVIPGIWLHTEPRMKSVLWWTFGRFSFRILMGFILRKCRFKEIRSFWKGRRFYLWLRIVHFRILISPLHFPLLGNLLVGGLIFNEVIFVYGLFKHIIIINWKNK